MIFKEVEIEAGGLILDGDLTVPESSRGVVLFAHGSGSSRHSPRNRFVAEVLNSSGLATLLFDLLTTEEGAQDLRAGEHRFDIELLARRLNFATDWILQEPSVHGLPIAYFGASTGGGAALVAAASRPREVAAVVSRGGRPDLAGDALTRVKAPTLLIVGSEDHAVIDLNRQALARMVCEVTLQFIPGATHLFEEPGALVMVAENAGEWLVEQFEGALHPVA